MSFFLLPRKTVVLLDSMIKIAHIVNPVHASPSSDLYVAQPITFETMRRAKEFASDIVDVELLTIAYQEDREVIPSYFKLLPDLHRSVLDVQDFESKRKLPILKDILDAMYQHSDADFLIYTNVDIAVLPHFYTTIASVIEKGHDAFVINRRTISNTYSQISDIPMMCLEAGTKHGGHDCYIFSRALYEKLYLDMACLGALRLGRSLTLALLCESENFKEFADWHLTFHIGDDQTWKSPKSFPYGRYNNAELGKAWDYYRQANKIPDHYLVGRCRPFSPFKERMREIRMRIRRYHRIDKILKISEEVRAMIKRSARK